MMELSSSSLPMGHQGWKLQRMKRLWHHISIRDAAQEFQHSLIQSYGAMTQAARRKLAVACLPECVPHVIG